GAACAPNMPITLGWVILFVAFHFFLFCNVFRIARHLELMWAVMFVLLAVCGITTGEPGLLALYCASSMFAVGLITWHMRQPSYHGIGWQRINPALPQWWQDHGPN
ncbi:MAG: hypothetical protein ACJ8GW_06430, partial [Massilia sp.]